MKILYFTGRHNFDFFKEFCLSKLYGAQRAEGC